MTRDPSTPELLPSKSERIVLRVAGLPFAVQGAGLIATLRTLGGFRPFVQPEKGYAEGDWLFRFQEGTEQGKDLPSLPLHHFQTEGIDCTFSRRGEGYAFSMSGGEGSSDPCGWVFPPSGKKALAWGEADRTRLRFSLWMAFGTAALSRGVAALHASAVCVQGKAVLVLGESGTGKSTHTRLWREYIPGAELLNDDSPFLEASEEGVRVWGSPWSGKTPCYRDLAFPVAGIVRLVQAPHNQIRRLSTLEAVGALLPSFPPSFAYDRAAKDRVLTLISHTLMRVPVFRLECRADEEAARVCYGEIFGNVLR